MPKLSSSQVTEIKIMQIKAILNPLGWKVSAQDLRQDQITLTVEMDQETLANEVEKLGKTPSSR